MSEAVELPNLPGYRLHPVPDSEWAFHKKQGLTYHRGYAVVASPAEPAAPASPRAGTAVVPTGTVQQPEAEGQAVVPSQRLPQWIVNDRKVLRWFGYFREQVTEGSAAEEAQRVRHIVVHYYLEDDTMDICEPRQDNSGLLQGMLIKRHQPKKDTAKPFAPADFAVGGSFQLYSRTFHIVDADTYTRSHMAAAGFELAPALTYPADPLEHYRAAFGRRTAAPEPRPPLHGAHAGAGSSADAPGAPAGTAQGGSRVAQYLENTRKVLRFFCVWDDRSSLQGDRRPYRLHFYLEDDSVEVLEVREPNSGRDAFPVFLRRAKLPKVQPAIGMTPLGQDKSARYYGPGDFRLGCTIDVHGRQFFLHDCDAFTRQFYQEKLGYSAEEMAAVDVASPAAAPPPSRALPPYNGFGSFEDSAQNCISLLPQQPKKNFYNLMQKHRIVLRFGCRFQETPTCRLTPADRERSFVLSYFCADDTLAIFEPPQRNSGVSGGKFLERMKVCWPADVAGSAATEPRYYCERDLALGAVLIIHRRAFELLSADEFTLQFMENNRHHFTQADARAALAAVQEQGLDGLQQALLGAAGTFDGQLNSSEPTIDFEGFEAALRASGHDLIRHQAMAIFRAVPRAPGCDKVSVSRLLECLSSGLSDETAGERLMRISQGA